MEPQEDYEPIQVCKKIRVKVVTNRGIQFITSIRQDAKVSDLANRALSVYLELAGELLPAPIRKQLTVSAVKQGVFYMPKSQYLANLMAKDEQVEVVIIKAKPKYPQQIFQEEQILQKNTIKQQNDKVIHKDFQVLNKMVEQDEEKNQKDVKQYEMELEPSILDVSRKQKKRNRKKLKAQIKKDNNPLAQADRPVNSNSKVHSIIAMLSQQNNRIMTEENQIEAFPTKKIKTDQICKPQKYSTQVVPSPKITFHSQPKIDSPQINKLDNAKKKYIKEEPDKMFSLEGVGSPGVVLKSPASVGLAFKSPVSQKTPLQVVGIQENSKMKEELSNFSLSRKGSEDRKPQTKHRKIAQENIHSKSVVVPSKNSGDKNQTIQQHTRTQSQRQQKLEMKLKPNPDKTVKKLLILEPPSQSESEQTKKVDNLECHSLRSKELIQLNNRMKTFALDSDDEE